MGKEKIVNKCKPNKVVCILNVFTLLCLCGGLIFIIMGSKARNDRIAKIEKRIYPSGNTQSLITTCQVDKKIDDAKVIKKDNSDLGYFYNSEGEKVRELEEFCKWKKVS